jgi:DNA-binding transcriptional MerR regulator
MLHPSYWISELADLTGVSTRTIRYYIEEGLLPSPAIQGKYAVFDDEYVERLKLIKYLKDAYLPLREIKLRMDQWDIAEIRRLVRAFAQDPFLAAREAGLSTPSPAPKDQVRESAASYLNRLMTSQQDQSVARQNRQSRPKAAADNIFQQLQAEYLKSASEPNQEFWQRFRINESIELWVRQPISSEVQLKLDSFIEQADRLFNQREENQNGTNQDSAQE